MSYQALYRSYRPALFIEVAGQQHVIKTIKNSLINDRTSHAYIFSGPRGIGKTTIARILAKALNCEQCQDGEPCNHCSMCQSINSGENQDIIEIDAASNNGVDEMRNLLEKVNFLPASGKHKIYIIDEVHMLSISAFNALLKTLEEPPKHVVFVLATTEPHKIPLTIMSRCQRFDYKPLTNKEIVQKLQEIADVEKISYQEGVLESIAEISEGGMRDALSILDQIYAYSNDVITMQDVDNVTGRISNQKLIELMMLFVEHDTSSALLVVNELIDMGKEVTRIIQNILLLTRDLLLYKSVNNKSQHKLVFDNPQFIKLAQNVERHKLFYFVEVLNDALNKVKATTFQKIYLEVAVMKLANATIDDYGSNSSTKNYSDSNIIIEEFEEQINRLKSQIKDLEEINEKSKITEFKEEIQGKITFLENIASKTVATPLELEKRIEALEEQGFNLNTSQDYSTQIKNIQRQLDDMNNNSNEQMIAIKTEVEKLSISEPPKTDSTIIYSSDVLDLEGRLEAVVKSMTLLQENINNLNEKINNNQEVVVATPQDDQLFFDGDDLNDTNYDKLTEEIDTIKEILNQINNDANHEIVQNLTNVNEELHRKFIALEGIVNNNSQVVNKLETDLASAYSQISPELIDHLQKEMSEIKRYSFQIAGQFKQLEEKINEKISVAPPAEPKPVVTVSNKITDNTISRVVGDPIKEVPYTKVEPVKDIIMEEKTIENDTETAKYYDHKILENAMHQARDRKYVNDREKIHAMWHTLPHKVNPSMLSIAKMLADGKMVLYSGNFIGLIYPTAPVCNQLMNPDNHFLAKQVLKTVLGRDYDFMALPENTWQEKKNEYHDQYYGGTKFPKLTPFRNPELKIITKSSDVFTPKKSLAETKAIEIFGEKLVKKEVL